MYRKFSFSLVILLVLCGFSFAQEPSNEAAQLMGKIRGPKGAAAKPAKKKRTRVVLSNGDLRSLGAPSGHYFPVDKVVAGNSAATARNFIAEHAAAYGVRSNVVDFSLKKSGKRNGRNYERFQQTYLQIPVFGAEMLVQLNDAGGVEFTLSDIMRDTGLLDSGQISTVPMVSAGDARDSAIALMAAEHSGVQLEGTQPRLMIYQPAVVGNTGQTHLVWQMEVKNVPAYLVNEMILIDAHTGQVALRFSQIKHARNREIYDSTNAATDPGTLERVEGELPSGIADVDAAYDFLGDTYDFYFTEHGRDSIDNAGLTMSATVRFCPVDEPCPFENAFWDNLGLRMYFGEGLVTDDVVAHELTHGVTQFESDLIYLNESGAINESFSDMWGEWVDLTNGVGNDLSSVRWQIGEDSILGSFRNMADPPQFSNWLNDGLIPMPDRKCAPGWYEGIEDSGGVHHNSSVGNKLCYLLTDGDTFQNVEIEGMGISATADLMYEAQTNLLTMASDYADFHITLTQAAINLRWTGDEQYNLKKACLVTELTKCFDLMDIIDSFPPFPDPMEWDIEPQATGFHTISMKAVAATDRSGVEYNFECVAAIPAIPDPDIFSSGWQSELEYTNGGFDPCTTYTFRVKARDLSQYLNETDLSNPGSATTSGVDNLPPFPELARWGQVPQQISYNTTIIMEAVAASDENGPVEYKFDCTSHPALTRDWGDPQSTDPIYMVTGLTIGNTYKFQLITRDTLGNSNSQPTTAPAVTLVFPPKIIDVPEDYSNIQDAIDAANNGDTVRIARGTYVGTGFHIDKNITVTGTSPTEPGTVAQTIIDCDGEWDGGFHLIGSGGGICALRGLTIINSRGHGTDGPDGLQPGNDGSIGWMGRRGGVTIRGNHIVANCVIRDCLLEGSEGGDGADGDENPGDENIPPDPNGGDGGPGASVFGAGIYIPWGRATITDTTVDNCIVIGGDGGDGGVGDDAAGPFDPPDDPAALDDVLFGGRGGNGGNAGLAWGGGVYCGPGTNVTFNNCIIKNCLAIGGTAGNGADGGAGDNDSELILGLISGGRGGHGGVPGSARGAGVFCDTGSSITFNNTGTLINPKRSEITGNRAFGGYGGNGGDAGGSFPLNWWRGGVGGLAFLSDTELNSPQGNVSPERYSANGGGVHLAHGSYATFTNCTIGSNNTRGSVSGQGGWPTYHAQEHPRKNYRIPSFGAGLCGEDAVVTFTHSTIESNETTILCNQYSDLPAREAHRDDLYSCNPDDYYTDQYTGKGGGVSFDGADASFYAEFNDCQVTGNYAPVGGGFYGRCNIGSGGGDFHVNNGSVFEENSAEHGGGAVWINSFGSIADSTIKGNVASAEGYGFGGGLYSLNSGMTITNSVITENDADGSGGGIFIDGPDNITGGNQDIINCLITDNTAILDGGGICADWDSEPTLTNCTLANNSAFYGGGVSSASATVWLYNNILWENVALFGSQIAAIDPYYTGAMSMVLPLYNDIQYGESDIYEEITSYVPWLAGNITEDPLFFDDYFLSQIAAGQLFNSPCFDTGSDLAANIGMDAYTTRIDSVFDANQVDMGYHHKLFTPVQYRLNVNLAINPNELDPNDFQLTPPSGMFNYYSRVYLSLTGPIPADYDVKWTGTDDDNLYGTSNMVLMDSNKTVTVELIKIICLLRVEVVGGNGTVNLLTDQVDANDLPAPTLTERYYKIGTVVDVIAYPDEVYRVKEWLGADNMPGMGLETNTVTAARDITVTVEFEKYICVLEAKVIGEHGTIALLTDAFDPNDPGTLTKRIYEVGTVVDVIAYPDEGYRAKEWVGADIMPAIGSKTNTVTITPGDDEVTVEFELPTTIKVPGDADTIQEAVGLAQEGDIVEVLPGTYMGGFIIIDKEITLRGTNPDDPSVVANTVIDCEGYFRMGVIFESGAGEGAILNGITIANGRQASLPGEDGEQPTDAEPGNNPNGGDGGCNQGGGIYCSAGSSPMIRNCVIRDCGIIGGNAGNGATADEFNDAGRGGWGGWARGGGVYVARDAAPTFINTTIRNCFATGGNGGNGGDYDEGDGYYSPAGIGGLWSNDFYAPWWLLTNSFGMMYAGDYGYYSSYGGGVYCEENSSATFIGCTITENRTRGGMSGIGGERPGIREQPVFSYEIPSYGGGVYCAEGSTVVFEGCTITNNVAPKPRYDPDTIVEVIEPVEGGDDIVVGITGTPIYHLDPYLGHGGGVAFEETASVIFRNHTASDGTVIRCTISENEASCGGGLYMAYDNLNLEDCKFSGNEAYQGGAIYATHSTATIAGGDFAHNFAGSIQGWDVDEVAGQGGAIYCASTEADIFDCNIMNNEATASGGGIFLTGGDANSPSIKNCLLAFNKSGRDGGGISVNWYSMPTISNCSIVENRVTGLFDGAGLGGGLYTSYHSDSILIDSILWNNTADSGRQLAVSTGFEFDLRDATLTVSYCDIQGGKADTASFVDYNCTLTWLDGIINDDPLFVTGPQGDHYLSQIFAGQTTNSPCVDTGSTFAGDVGMHEYVTRNDDAYAAYDNGIVDMGYHYPPPIPLELCRFCDFLFDGIVTIGDLEIITNHWLDDCKSVDCEGSNLTSDDTIDMLDFAIFATCWLAEDNEPPKPDPAQWQLPPYRGLGSTGNSMMAEIAQDTWSETVEYQFECIEGTPQNISLWQTDPCWVDTGLVSQTSYTYVVRTRDQWGNTTEDSIPASITAGEEWGVPVPDPARFATIADDGFNGAPKPYGDSAVTMTAATATDPEGNGIEYKFFCTTDGNFDSDWQPGPTYTATGLTIDVEYCFYVIVRDTSSNSNETAPSETLCSLPGTPNYAPYPTGGAIGDRATFAILPYQIGDFHIMAATVAVDDEGDAIYYFFECLDDGDYSSTWQTLLPDPNPNVTETINGIEVTYSNNPWAYEPDIGMPTIHFWYQVKYRDDQGNESQYSIADQS